MEYRHLIVFVVILNGKVLNIDGQAGQDAGLVESKLDAGQSPQGQNREQGGPGGPGGPGNREERGQRPGPNEPTTKKVKKRTTPRRISLEENCDYLAYYCMKAYKTGRLCARTIYYKYHNFTNYCMMDYVNCMERYEVWQVVHMGDCFKLKELDDYQHYEYHDDLFLDQIYVIQE